MCVNLTMSLATGNYQVNIGKSSCSGKLEKRHGNPCGTSRNMIIFSLTDMQGIISSSTCPSGSVQDVSPIIPRSLSGCPS